MDRVARSRSTAGTLAPMSKDKKFDEMIGAIGEFARTHDAAAVSVFRASIADGVKTGALVLDLGGEGQQTSLSMKEREEVDGNCEDGFLPLVWVSGDSRKVVGEIEAKDLLDHIDKEIAKKPKAVN